MIALPLNLVPTFEARLERAWGHRAWCKARDALAISFGLCGLRWNEVSNMRFRDIDEHEGRLVVRSAKGGIRRTLPVGVHIIEALRCLTIKQRPKGISERLGLCFYSRPGQQLRYEHINRRLRDWTNRVFGRPYTFHCLRHTAAVRVYQETKDVLIVQRFLGHKSLMWTETYLRSLTDPGFVGLPTYCTQSAFKPRLFDPDDKLGRGNGPTWTPPARRAAA